MNYNVIKIEPKTVAKAGMNQGKKYVECTIRSAQGETRIVPVFDAEAEAYLNCIATTKGGNAMQDTPIPEELAVWQYCFDQEFVFPSPMMRINATTGQPELNKFNQPYIRTSVRVLTRYQLDEQLALLNPGGTTLAPRRGWDLQTRGTSVMNSFYTPVVAQASDNIELPLTTAGGQPV